MTTPGDRPAPQVPAGPVDGSVDASRLMEEIKTRVRERRASGFYSEDEVRRITQMEIELAESAPTFQDELEEHLERLNDDWDTAAEPALAKSADDAGLHWGPCPAFLPAGCGIAVLHGDPSKPNADILFRVPGKSDIAVHTHTSPKRMVLVSGELLVSYEGQPEA